MGAAEEACCACGGGDRSEVTRGPTRAPTRAPGGPTRPPTMGPTLSPDVTVSDYKVASVTAYDEEDMDEICKEKFGSRATVADWNDFDDMSAKRLEMTLDDLNLSTSRKYFVTLDDKKYEGKSLKAFYVSNWEDGESQDIDTIRISGEFALALRSEVDIAGRVICKTVAISK